MLDYLTLRQKEDQKFSARKWSREMNLKGHSLLVMLLQGKRSLRTRHVDFLKTSLQLNKKEELFLKTLIQYENATDMKDKAHLAELLEEFHPEKNFESTLIDQFKIVSDWYYMAILAMTELKNFSGSEKEIFERFGGKLSSNEIRLALLRLKALGLLKSSPDGQLKATYKRITTANDLLNEGARIYHAQVMELAISAQEKLPLENREFQSFSMAVSEDKIPLIKEMIRNFRTKLSKAVSGNGDHVYQVNIHFFQLTEGPVVKD